MYTKSTLSKIYLFIYGAGLAALNCFFLKSVCAKSEIEKITHFGRFSTFTFK